MLALEVQLSPITDAEVLARREDYLHLGIPVVWVWRGSPPHVLYRSGEPGWIYDLDQDQIGLVCGKPHPAGPGEGTDGGRTYGPHWPPCPRDATTTRWMPLADVRLTRDGLEASEQVLARLAREAAEATRRARAERSAAASPHPGRRAGSRVLTQSHWETPPSGAGSEPIPGKTGEQGGDRYRRLAQARARTSLTERIREVEARIAELQRPGSEPARGADNSNGSPVAQSHSGTGGQIGDLANCRRRVKTGSGTLSVVPWMG
jgi:hypothetical protein